MVIHSFLFALDVYESLSAQPLRLGCHYCIYLATLVHYKALASYTNGTLKHK